MAKEGANSLRDRLLKTSTLKHAALMSDSMVYNVKDETLTPIPALNVAYSSRVNGGLMSGLTTWAGPSKHFKTLFCLITAAAYLRSNPDSVCIFYDSEFGSPKEYFVAAGIEPDRVLHSPITSLEELRTDLANQLKAIERGDKVIIVVDSLGNLASNKETKDAEEGSDKADMTRAKVIKSMFRIVTPHLRLKDIPMLVVAHTYDTLEMYSTKVVSGGTGTYYSSDNIYIVGRQQDKEGKEVIGYDFIINVEKSRYVKEKAKIPIKVLRNGGVMKWSGLFDIALEGNYITNINKSNYARVNKQTNEPIEEKFSRSDVENNGEFWKNLFSTTDFADYIHQTYTNTLGSLISTDVTSEEDEMEQYELQDNE